MSARETVALIDQVPKAGRIDATRKHSRWSGGFGVSPGQIWAARFRQFSGGLRTAENVAITGGALALIPAQPLYRRRARGRRTIRSVMRVSSTTAPDQDDQPGAKGGRPNHIKHQQAPLSDQHCPLIRRAP